MPKATAIPEVGAHMSVAVEATEEMRQALAADMELALEPATEVTTEVATEVVMEVATAVAMEGIVGS